MLRFDRLRFVAFGIPSLLPSAEIWLGAVVMALWPWAACAVLRLFV